MMYLFYSLLMIVHPFMKHSVLLLEKYSTSKVWKMQNTHLMLLLMFFFFFFGEYLKILWKMMQD